MTRFLVLVLLATVGIAGEARAQVNADYDNRNGVTLGDTAYTSADTFARSVLYDTTTFGEGEEYTASARAYAECAAKGARSGWFRFNTAVDGTAFLTVDSAAKPYDVFYIIYTAPNTIRPGTATIGQLTQLNCINSNHGPPNESYTLGHPIPAGNVLYVQTLSVCAERTTALACDDVERQNAIGGPTSVSFTFDPDDSPDEDGVPNPLDKCPSVDGVVGGTPDNGCPDADSDGVTEPGDACPGVTGFDGTGCRKPDHDGDGYVDTARGGDDCDDNNRDRNPGVPEVPGNAVDENCDTKDYLDADGDNHDDQIQRQDCQPQNPKVHADAEEIIGNNVDENCDGTKTPFPALQNLIQYASWKDRATEVGLQNFIVSDARKGMTIRIYCKGSQVDCPYGSRTISVKKNAKKLKVATEFAREKGGEIRLLAPGTKITIALSMPQRVGRARRYVVRNKGSLKATALCTEAGSTTLQARCTGIS